MTDFQVSSCAYVKMLLHAAKYPHNAVNGVLLAEKDRPDGKTWRVVDAIPLFHISLYLAPMAEIALVHVDELAATRNLKVVGYYCAHENLNNNGVEGAPGIKVADKIAEHFPNACLLVVSVKGILSLPPFITPLSFRSTINWCRRWPTDLR